MCSKVGTLVDSYLNYHINKAWMFHDLITNEHCPVCHKEIFWFVDNDTYNHLRTIKLACDFCLATYRLTTHKDEEDKRVIDKIIQAYQGTMNGQIYDLMNIKNIKRYLSIGGK